MNKIKKNCSICCLIFLTFFLFSCGNLTKNTDDKVALDSSNNKKEIYIPIVAKGWQQQYWQSVKMGAEKAAKEYKVKITFEAPEGDESINKQIKIINAALSKKPNAIILAANDSILLIPELEKAKADNIPVIMFDSGVNSDIPVTTVATNNEVSSSAAADKMALAIGQEGEVAIICHDSNFVSSTGIKRRDGFVNRIKDKYPNIKIVDMEYGGSDRDVAKNITDTIIDKYPNIKGIYATNEGSTYGMINGIIEKDKVGKIIIVGFDAGKMQKDAARSGIMLGGISQNPVEIGYKAVEAAYKVSNGETVEKDIDTGYVWYDKNNVDNEDLKLLLYD